MQGSCIVRTLRAVVVLASIELLLTITFNAVSIVHTEAGEEPKWYSYPITPSDFLLLYEKLRGKGRVSSSLETDVAEPLQIAGNNVELEKVTSTPMQINTSAATHAEATTLLPASACKITDGIRTAPGGVSTCPYPGDPVPLNRIARLLPPCDVVKRSTLASTRCGVPGHGTPIPLLVTGTPRSGTVEMQLRLRSMGLDVTNDFQRPGRHGTSSWMMAFEDREPFGPVRLNGKRFSVVVHQVREPLSSLASMCTEPIKGKMYAPFLSRHIYVQPENLHVPGSTNATAILQFWVGWHEFLDSLGLYTYQLEDTKSVWRVMDQAAHVLGRKALTEDEVAARLGLKDTTAHQANQRHHRPPFTWSQLWALNSTLASKAWDMAAAYGYTYADVSKDLLSREIYTGAIPTC